MGNIQNIIPEIWTAGALSAYRDAIIFGSLANTSYQAAVINAGDTVKLNTIVPFTAQTYDPIHGINYTDVDATQVEIKVDQEVVVPGSFPDIITYQTNMDLFGTAVSEMGSALAENIDSYLAELHANATTKIGTTGSPVELTSADMLDLFSEVAKKLSEKKTPKNNLVCVAPPWFTQKVLKANVTKDTANSEALSNGFVGKYWGFELFETNLVATHVDGSSWSAPMFFRKFDSIGLVDQIKSFEVIRDKDYMKDYARLYGVYGAKIVRPDTVATVYSVAGAESGS
jgi:hypothetical protein